MRWDGALALSRCAARPIDGGDTAASLKDDDDDNADDDVGSSSSGSKYAAIHTSSCVLRLSGLCWNAPARTVCVFLSVCGEVAIVLEEERSACGWGEAGCTKAFGSVARRGVGTYASKKSLRWDVSEEGGVVCVGCDG